MLGLLLRRTVTAVPTIIAVTALLFFSVMWLLGNPAEVMLGQDASPEAIKLVNEKFGFDQPLAHQYFSWLKSAAGGRLGISFATNEDVAGIILKAAPVTLELAFWSIALAALAALFINTIPIFNSKLYGAITGAILIGLTVPNFMLGIILILVFSVNLGWLPTTGWLPWSAGAWLHLKHLILPVLTLAAYYFAVFSIVYRAEHSDVSAKMYTQVARAKGSSEWRVAFKHVLPNAALPVITFVGLSMGQLVGGAVVTETVFSMPGMGRLFVSAISARDFPVILAIGIVIICGVVIMNFLADVFYSLVNPQIHM